MHNEHTALGLPSDLTACVFGRMRAGVRARERARVLLWRSHSPLTTRSLSSVCVCVRVCVEKDEVAGTTLSSKLRSCPQVSSTQVRPAALRKPRLTLDRINESGRSSRGLRTRTHTHAQLEDVSTAECRRHAGRLLLGAALD